MAYHDPNLRPGPSSQLPGVFQNFVAGALGAGCLPAVVYCWETYFGGTAPEWVKGVGPNVIGAVVLIPTFWLISRSARLVWSRWHTGSPRARGDRLAIYVAWIDGDDARGTARASIMASLRREIGPDTVEVLPAGLHPRWRDDLGFDAIRAATERKAHRLLRRKGGHLLIWGRRHQLDGRSILELNFTSPESIAAEGRYGFTDKLLLDAPFGPDAGAALAAVAAALAAPAANNSRYIAERLRPLADRLRPLAQRPPRVLRSEDRARIYFSYALLRETIGAQCGQSDNILDAIVAYREALRDYALARVPLAWATTQNNLGGAFLRLGELESNAGWLHEAITAFSEALKVRTRDRLPFDWAMTKTNLGAVLLRLAEHERNTERLEKAIAVFNKTLEMITREREPLAWATIQNNLGSALALLAEWKHGTDAFEEAIVAFRRVLKVMTRKRAPLDWAMAQHNLGNALMRLGERESGTDQLKEAVAAYREALKECTRQRMPLDCAGTQNNLGNTLALLGERENDRARLREAVTIYREALRVRTRENGPLDWARAQNNLGNALKSLSERESGTDRLEQAVAAYDAALEVFVAARPDYYVQTMLNRARAVALLEHRQNAD